MSDMYATRPQHDLDAARHPSERVCGSTGKLMYTSPEAAERRRRTIKKRRDEKLSVYRCTHCRCWHLGHRAH